MFLELAQLQIDERHREMDRVSLAKLARQNRSETQKHNVLARLARSRRRLTAPAA